MWLRAVLISKAWISSSILNYLTTLKTMCIELVARVALVKKGAP